MTTALTIMRLQPFHNGHKKIIDTMLKENKKVILLIGSMDLNDNKNPYSFHTRKQMIESVYLAEIKSNKLIVQGIKDINNPPKWVDYVKKQLPLEASIYYCGYGQDADLFKEKGFKVKQFSRQDLPISGTLIREKIKINDPSWKQDVPPEIHFLI
ncbi:MAG: adenylyltransferase/cytidyltransferase family protein [Alphaproteobacteria bacterium]|nr:adenylyltransferase/cytidyltransferase family protein [Alphaproteobacteria bacterium]